ncbi:MAG: RiPP maturation radical SAM C-methyltransferase, partial [Planctomycetes bacterium]|nr:RiPP maturation radical SAM C-methyltransferase [Planctomycetota bacterium]
MSRLPANGTVALVCMPWQPLEAPSIQLGILHALLARAGIACRSHSLHLELMAFLRSAGKDGGPLLTVGDYRVVGDFLFMHAPGEWVFANPPVRRHDRREDRRYLRLLKQAGASNALVARLERLRARIPEFVAARADDILAHEPAVVGFTTTLGQTVASLALASALKARRPELVTIFGGAGCEGVMGEALHRCYPFVDVVVRGEGEPVLETVVRAALAGEPIPALSGLCVRDPTGGTLALPVGARPPVAMDDTPPPDYDEYFERLYRLGLEHDVTPVLPYESSRGCWWGQKSQCAFCGLNGESMAFRSKSQDRVVDELLDLSDRHRVLEVTVVDNILDQRYFDSALPRLARAGLDLDLFYQTKANLSIAHLGALRDAGVRRIRPGIESLSTPQLRRMRKGVTALQNVRLLKWCAELGIRVAWNLLYGLPGEQAEESAAMAELIPLLVHLDPPALSPLTLDRFSPYFANPEAFGIELRGAPGHQRVLHDVDDRTHSALAWTFDFRLAD